MAFAIMNVMNVLSFGTCWWGRGDSLMYAICLFGYTSYSQLCSRNKRYFQKVNRDVVGMAVWIVVLVPSH